MLPAITVQWGLAGFFLYAEILWITVMLLPVLSANRWRKFFDSDTVRLIRPRANFYFNIFLTILAILFIDALREVIRYNRLDEVVINVADTKSPLKSSSTPLESGSTSPPVTSGSGGLVREARAERNIYISGMALFLWFIIKRLIVLMYEVADLNDAFEQKCSEVDIVRKELNETINSRITATIKRTGHTEDKKLTDDDDEQPVARDRSRSRLPKKEL